ncbi:MAG: helix-turn-helix domain-containing protein [Oscillospiraceae bacterium]|nr:helix-turn-helix domain-containing protein [Oscillospiraceae bacterium]
MSERLAMSVEEMADSLGINRISAYQLTKRQDFYPAFRIGRRILINTSRLQTWMDEQGR